MNRWYGYRRWVYGVLVGVLVLDAAVYFAWLRQPPLPPDVATGRVAELERDVTELTTEVGRLEETKAQVPELNTRLQAFLSEHFVAENTGFASVAGELQEAASQSGVVLESVTYRSDEAAQRSTPESLTRVEVTGNVEGSYASVLEYLASLEGSPHFYLIEELRVAGSRGHMLRLEMKLSTFFLRGRS